MRCPDCGSENLAGAEDCVSCSAPIASYAAQATGKDQKRILEGTIRDLKPHDAIALYPSRTVTEAVELMRTHKIGCVVVAEKGGSLAGIFTERDLLRKVAGRLDPSKTRLAAVMRADIEPLHEGDTVAFAFHNMAVHDYRHIPVEFDDGSLAVITSRDLLRYLCK
ncbi:MAG: CBS domain-containing protein [Elusimicrobia bacterium]|nr:CBS domain-containing protein [Elusimicrobiota bacterium]